MARENSRYVNQEPTGSSVIPRRDPMPVGSKTLDWRENRTAPGICILLDEESATWLANHLPGHDEATRELNRAMESVFEEGDW